MSVYLTQFFFPSSYKLVVFVVVIVIVIVVNMFHVFWSMIIATAYFGTLVYSLPVPTNMTVEYQDTPQNIDVQNPRFAFVVDCGDEWHSAKSDCSRGLSVHGYRVVVKEISSGEEIWDSKIKSSDGRTSQIVFDTTTSAEQLKANTDYEWQAEWFTDDKGTLGGRATSVFSTALFQETDWQGAQWIGTRNQRHLRRNITIPTNRKVVRSRAFVAAPGCHALLVNGMSVNDTLGVCPWTQFDHTVLYQTHDLTKLLTGGDNTVELLLGSGMWVHTGAKDPSVRVNVPFHHTVFLSHFFYKCVNSLVLSVMFALVYTLIVCAVLRLYLRSHLTMALILLFGPKLRKLQSHNPICDVEHYQNTRH